MLPLITGYFLAIVLALVVGYWVGNAAWSKVLMLGAAAVFSLVMFGFQKRAWVLIVFGWLFTGQLLMLPLPFGVNQLMIMLAVCAYLGYRVVSRRSVRAGVTLIDLLLLINLGWIAFDFCLHPVGFWVFQSEMIGAKPYLNIMMAVAAFWVLVHLPDSVKTVSRIPYFILAAAIVLAALQLVGLIFPSTVPYIYAWYSNIDVEAYAATVSSDTGSLGRIKSFAGLGLTIIPVLCSYYPTASLFNPRRGRCYAMLLGLVSILLSGFRSAVIWAAAAVAIGGLFYRRWRDLAIGAVVGALLLGALVVGQGRLYHLPQGVQRTLCFLPGQWSPDVVDEAESSSEWRFTLWKLIIERHLIKDWWFGDGFGVRAADMIVFSRQTSVTLTDFVLETGAYHSGPLTTIRYVGIVGLVLLYSLWITAGVYVYKLVQRCRGTILFPVSIFLAIQLIWSPLHFAFVFGNYSSYFPDLIVQLGILRVLMRFEAEGLIRPTAPSTVIPKQIPTLV